MPAVGGTVGGTEYRLMPSACRLYSASEIVKFTISIPRESCTNAKAKYSSSVVPPDPSVHLHKCATQYVMLKTMAYQLSIFSSFSNVPLSTSFWIISLASSSVPSQMYMPRGVR